MSDFISTGLIHERTKFARLASTAQEHLDFYAGGEQYGSVNGPRGSLKEPKLGRRLGAALALCSALMWTAPSALGHGAVHEQISAITERLKAAPEDAMLYVRRGRLYLEAAHLDDAVRDFEQALTLDGKLAPAHYFLGLALLQAQRARAAEASARRFLGLLTRDDRGGRYRGQLLLARSLSAQKRDQDASIAYEAALATGLGEPDDYLEYARVAERAGGVERALAVLDAGQKKLGVLAALVERAVQLELGQGNTDAALLRLDELIRALPQPCAQLKWKGDVLRRLRRNHEAHQAYSQAWTILEALNPARRRAPAYRQLALELERALAATR